MYIRICHVIAEADFMAAAKEMLRTGKLVLRPGEPIRLATVNAVRHEIPDKDSLKGNKVYGTGS